MIRKILCQKCNGKSKPLHPEDTNAGWKVRVNPGVAFYGYVCDTCGAGIAIGENCFAQTYWQAEQFQEEDIRPEIAVLYALTNQPPLWEREYININE